MTAMMQQYKQIKQNYADCLLFFRLGDFYELFFEDAETASVVLDIALTGRNYGEAERAPMCGVPHHSAETYIARLIEKGFRVAICEQMEQPKPSAKGPVRREVVRIVTPGTITDAAMLDSQKNNYILALYVLKKGCSLAVADITTGEFSATYFTLEDGDEQKRILDELTKYAPAEIITSEDFPYTKAVMQLLELKPVVLPTWVFNAEFAYKTLTQHFQTMHLEAFALAKTSPEILAAAALLNYLQETQRTALSQITAIKAYSEQGFLILDRNTRQNLELTTPLRSSFRRSNRKNTLLSVIDRTCTPSGARLLRNWIETPLTDPQAINRRLDAVEEWVNQSFVRTELRDLLRKLHDIERLITRLVGTNGNAKDMAVLRNSLAILPQIKELLSNCKVQLNQSMHQTFDDLQDIYALIKEILTTDPPISLKEGGLIRKGYNAELDKLLDAKSNGYDWLENLELRERNKTGIKSLKVRYNRVFGYFIEVTKSNIAAVPESYVRKQTLSGSERYTTPELDELAENILTADQKCIELEFAIFESLRQEVAKNIERVQFMAQLLASLDVLQALADIAENNNYCKPTVDNSDKIDIQAGRHLVLEQAASFVPNDTNLNNSAERMAVITGPNMAGKSTYMRQVALIVLLAQMGSFVPAKSAHIGVVDRIFTRVGASDDLAEGQSTFMVEMTEVAFILNHATQNSLIVMDEIGRGTSTYDGLSIAWSVLEYIDAHIKAKTLFATHYHELIVMEERLDCVRNYSFTLGDENIFLRKLIRGGADKSYGIQVAKLAGLPPIVLQRAEKVLATLERDNSLINTAYVESFQLTLE
ncbi:MAG: DNA mismatch repair protein MutS [Defluviitaleaceae bacterium]|nr:DNA mismatch repair protein MutS [Defluviitaleaceae bacterium]